jgi:hypothetical protein
MSLITKAVYLLVLDCAARLDCGRLYRGIDSGRLGLRTNESEHTAK